MMCVCIKDLSILASSAVSGDDVVSSEAYRDDTKSWHQILANISEKKNPRKLDRQEFLGNIKLIDCC